MRWFPRFAGDVWVQIHISARACVPRPQEGLIWVFSQSEEPALRAPQPSQEPTYVTLPKKRDSQARYTLQQMSSTYVPMSVTPTPVENGKTPGPPIPNTMLKGTLGISLVHQLWSGGLWGAYFLFPPVRKVTLTM